MGKIKFKLVSSLEKVLPGQSIDGYAEQLYGSMLKNEVYSFQIAAEAVDFFEQRIFCKIQINSPIANSIKLYNTGCVPVMVPCYKKSDEEYITKEPCVLPDPLYEIKGNKFELASNQSRAIWVAVELNGEYCGDFPIEFKIYDKEDNLVETLNYNIHIIDANLPELDIYNTGWFHGDCLAKHHNAPIFSMKYFEILKKYLKVYVKFGHNMILTPIFTPPLDTAVGGERETNQLVDVEIKNGKYIFGFEKLVKWIKICEEVGIKYFEISHLYTQWGAVAAPKIMAWENGEYHRIFGWETDAHSKEYQSFLKAFLPELVSVLKKQKVWNRCFFHVSDEPAKEHIKKYAAAKTILSKYVGEKRIIDALSDYSYYENGLIKTPIVPNDEIGVFLENKSTNLWTYYCCIQGEGVANRFIAMPSYRNRILGWQLYKNEIKGFLQWGFNFWLSQYSVKAIDPYADTTAGGGFPSGDAFVVYPLDENGEVVCSLRLYVFNEAMQDLRALKMLESLGGKEAVLDLVAEIDSFLKYPKESDFILKTRDIINRRIEKLI